jgi:hypothetical protein
MLWLVELRSLDQSEPLPHEGSEAKRESPKNGVRRRGPAPPGERTEAARPPQVNQDSPDPEGVL